MKKLLIGLLAICSISIYASDSVIDVEVNSITFNETLNIKAGTSKTKIANKCYLIHNKSDQSRVLSLGKSFGVDSVSYTMRNRSFKSDSIQKRCAGMRQMYYEGGLVGDLMEINFTGLKSANLIKCEIQECALTVSVKQLERNLGEAVTIDYSLPPVVLPDAPVEID